MVAFLLVGLLLKFVREYGFSPALLPLDVEGTSPNFIVTLASPFLLLAKENIVSFLKFYQTALGGAVVMTVYEIVQRWLPGRTFDIWDIVASFMGAFAAI
ncbi:MAG: hypothetical protein AAF514_00840, partial [Verrucomicrobiota bacterium]